MNEHENAKDRERDGGGTMMQVVCRKAYAAVQTRELLTAGMAHAAEVTFTFSSEWEKLEKTAVFTDGSTTVDVPQAQWSAQGTVSVPHEVLAVPGRRVRVGVYGTDGVRVVLPTVWAELGVVLSAADPSGDVSTDPSLPVWAVIQAQIGDLDNLITGEKGSLVAAINEAARSGGGTPAATHSVTWALEHVSSSNTVTVVQSGSVLTAVLTAETGYTLGEVSVTMGGATLSGVWDAESARLLLPAITGDVVVCCVGVEIPKPDTTPVIEVEGKGINSTGQTINAEGWGYTKFYPVNDTSVICNFANSAGLPQPSGNAKMTIFLDEDTSPFPGHVLGYANPLNTPGKDSLKSNVDESAVGLRATLILAEIDNCYCYEVNTGTVIFAGKNTPYYGLTNRSEVATALSVDDDMAQDYAVAVTSVLGETPAVDTETAYGLSADLVKLITETKTAWMSEYGGDFRKIPLIVTTDQHGRRNAGLFKLLGKTLSMHDVSKICNLGDTVGNAWVDADETHTLLRCGELESWCESVKDIPMSRQLNVFGNHDTWCAQSGETDAAVRYPSSQAHLNQYFRNLYARRTNNNGWFAVRDDAFNVKYVVISGFAYQDGSGSFRVSTEQMTWLIDELSRNDGYAVVLVSHVPLHYATGEMTYPTGFEPTAQEDYRVFDVDTDALFTARRNGTAGAVTDSEGVVHSYDFSVCTAPLLCALHGHTHHDAYCRVGNALLSYCFDWFADNTVFFVLIDRVDDCLRLWKVEGDTLRVQSYQVPLSAATTEE